MDSIHQKNMKKLDKKKLIDIIQDLSKNVKEVKENE